MSETNLRGFYERYIEALNAHEFDRMDEFIHESVVLHSEPSSRAVVVVQLESIVDAVPDSHWEPQEIAVNGDTLATRLINTGTPTKERRGAAPTGSRSRSSSTPSTACATGSTSTCRPSTTRRPSRSSSQPDRPSTGQPPGAARGA